MGIYRASRIKRAGRINFDSWRWKAKRRRDRRCFRVMFRRQWNSIGRRGINIVGMRNNVESCWVWNASYDRFSTLSSMWPREIDLFIYLHLSFADINGKNVCDIQGIDIVENFLDADFWISSHDLERYDPFVSIKIFQSDSKKESSCEHFILIPR